jgi:DNA replication protein DnaC
MAEAGFPARTQTGDGTCERCGGSGWIIIEKEGVSGAERCECALASRPSRLEALSGIPPKFAAKTLENFVPPNDNPVVADILRGAMNDVRRYTQDFVTLDRRGLLFVGDTGSGKTHLGVAALHRLMAQGHECLFFDYQDLLDRIRRGWNASAGTSDREAYQSALDCEVLMIDDLGANRAIEWMEDIIFGIISYRYNQSKAIIATTNLPDDDERIVEYTTAGNSPIYRKTLSDIIGSRASSRLHEMCKVVKMRGLPDYRKR